MDGALALVFGLVIVAVISVTPLEWRKAAGGLLIAATVFFIVFQLLR